MDDMNSFRSSVHRTRTEEQKREEIIGNVNIPNDMIKMVRGNDVGNPPPAAVAQGPGPSKSSSAPSKEQIDAMVLAVKKKTEKKNSGQQEPQLNGNPPSKFREKNKFHSSKPKVSKNDSGGKGRGNHHDQNAYYNRDYGNGRGGGGEQKGAVQPRKYFVPKSSLTGINAGPHGDAPLASALSSDKSRNVTPIFGGVQEMIASIRAKHCSSKTPVLSTPTGANAPKIPTTSQVGQAGATCASALHRSTTGSGHVTVGLSSDAIVSSLSQSLGTLLIKESPTAASSVAKPDPRLNASGNHNGIIAPTPKPRQKPSMVNPFMSTSTSTAVITTSKPVTNSAPATFIPSFSSMSSTRDFEGGKPPIASYSLGNMPKLLSTSTSSKDNEADLSSLVDLLKKHEQNQEADVSQQLLQKEEARVIINAPRRIFNKNKVPRKILEQCRLLPIYSRKDNLIETLRDNQFLIVIGETGSGKSTQIPQYLVEAGLNGMGKIAVTQPRRVAAKSLADRVAAECGVQLGGVVGYAVRFDKKVTANTIIKYLTDGLLVRECASEMNLDTYSIIIIDEAHERSIHTDVCFGLLKRAAARRPDLRVIISSATLDERKFSKFFNNAAVFNVSGKGFDVEIIYNPKSEYDYLQGAVDTVMKINRSQPRGKDRGDILVFLSGQDEIEQVWDLLDEKLRTEPSSLYDELKIVPCYGALPFSEQQDIFQETPLNCRKVVLATNIAETSLTIDGIVYVIDSGYYKQNLYNPKSGIYSLERRQITRAIQRAGRAGRTRAGKCYRLYTQQDFEMFMQDAPDPEVTQCNLESVLLDIIALGIANPLNFDFMDPPPKEAIAEGIKHLQELSALDGELKLTDCGRRMSEFPLDPPLAKVILESVKLGCSTEVLKIVAFLSTQHQNIFSRYKRNRQQSDASRMQFSDGTQGDLATFLKVYNAWYLNDKREDWCQARAIQHRILVEADEIMDQLKGILNSRGIPHGYGASRCSPHLLHENIRRAFTAGYFRQLAKKKPNGHAYQILGDSNGSGLEDVFLHPSSSLFHTKHPLVIYQEVMKTSKTYIRGVFPIEIQWIAEYAPGYYLKLPYTFHC